MPLVEPVMRAEQIGADAVGEIEPPLVAIGLELGQHGQLGMGIPGLGPDAAGRAQAIVFAHRQRNSASA